MFIWSTISTYQPVFHRHCWADEIDIDMNDKCLLFSIYRLKSEDSDENENGESKGKEENKPNTVRNCYRYSSIPE